MLPDFHKESATSTNVEPGACYAGKWHEFAKTFASCCDAEHQACFWKNADCFDTAIGPACYRVIVHFGECVQRGFLSAPDWFDAMRPQPEMSNYEKVTAALDCWYQLAGVPRLPIKTPHAFNKRVLDFIAACNGFALAIDEASQSDCWRRLSSNAPQAPPGAAIEPTVARPAPPVAKTPTMRKRRRETVKRPLTERQVESQRLFGECNGNLAEIARRMGLSVKTVRQHLDAGNRKLGRALITEATTRAMRHDRRGQADLTAEDDRRR